MHEERDSTPVQVRLGAASIGLLLGLASGLVVALACAMLGAFSRVSFAGWVFGTGVGAALACLAYPALAFLLLPAFGQLVVGYAAASLSRDNAAVVQPDRSLPAWLRIVFALGGVGAVAVAAVALVLNW